MKIKYKDDYASNIFFDEVKLTKEEEKEIVRNFLLRLQIDYIDFVEFEKPDLIITFQDDLKVGCEVTKYFADPSRKGSISKKSFAEWKKFAQKLKKELIKRNKKYKYVYGAIHFKESKCTRLPLADNSFIKELVDIVDIYYTDVNPSKILYSTKLSVSKFNLIKEFVDHIYLKNIYPKNQYL